MNNNIFNSGNGISFEKTMFSKWSGFINKTSVYKCKNRTYCVDKFKEMDYFHFTDIKFEGQFNPMINNINVEMWDFAYED